MQAKQSEVGKLYSTRSGVRVEVVEKSDVKVVVKSNESGNLISVPPEYELKEIIMSDVTPTPTPVTETTQPVSLKKTKKSNIVDDGLKNGLSTDDIVKNVLATFPDNTEKAIRNLISVRRSKLKKA
jgi:hypothetical protein